jgi:hypothetical protein
MFVEVGTVVDAAPRQLEIIEDSVGRIAHQTSRALRHFDHAEVHTVKSRLVRFLSPSLIILSL